MQTTSFIALSQIVRTEGLAQLYRGAPLVAIGAIPSHALYFGMYEATNFTGCHSHAPSACIYH